MEYKKPKVTLLNATPLWISEGAGRVCYDSFDMSENEQVKSFPNVKEDIESSELLEKLSWVHHHESVLEHTSLSFYIQNVSREVIIEWNRHRIGMPTSQKSTRYTIEPLIDAWVDLNDNFFSEDAHNAFEKVVKDNVIHNDFEMIMIISDYLYKSLKRYHEEEPLVKGLTGSKKKKQNDRVKRCLPESWMTEGVWTFNLRALKHFISLRGSGAAYPYIRELTQEIINATPDKYLRLVKK